MSSFHSLGNDPRLKAKVERGRNPETSDYLLSHLGTKYECEEKVTKLVLYVR